jgi:hypothetical protein
MKGRYGTRVPLKAWVFFWNSEVSGEGRLLDLTAPGCQIETTGQTIAPGQYLELRIMLPSQTALLAVELAAVRWAKGRRFGAEFIRMDSSDEHMLNALIARPTVDLWAVNTDATPERL